MSVTDSRTDLDAAKATLVGKSDEELLADLGYWTVAARDHVTDFLDLEQREQRVRELHAEAETWTRLVADEMRSRRDARRSAPPNPA